MFRIMTGPAMLDWIRAAASTQSLCVSFNGEMGMLISLAVMFLCFTYAQPAAPVLVAQGANAQGVHARPYLEYGNVCWDDERSLLDTFAFVLASDPDAIGYITVFDGGSLLPQGGGSPGHSRAELPRKLP
jgi:hypothetical protein